MEQFIPIPFASLPNSVDKLKAIRFNSLGSLYYFVKIGLQRKRLTPALHFPVCSSLERDHIKDLYEMPRDHFKSTICTEGLPMWWALPFMASDEDMFKKAGYSDDFIKWMRRAHNPNVRTLLVSENITNASKLGKRVRWHFESNAIYRGIFPETLPTTSEIWTNFSLHLNLRQFGTGASHGEGTFDFIGVGGALQSRHYNKLIQDDLVGRKAVDSPAVMDDTIEYHRLVPGAFESEDKDHEADELVIGNRWGFHDLNSYIREHEEWFRIVSHSALGGCCPEHPADVPIFPEEFSYEKLLKLKRRFGAYNFSCQYLNNPCSPEDADFQESWLGYYKTVRNLDGRLIAVHEVRNGVVFKDIHVGHMAISMAVDPNHSGNAAAGRCRHAIVVLGKVEDDKSGDKFYLLDTWAQQCSYGLFIDQIYKMADRWKLRRFGVETCAGQIYLKFHLDERNLREARPLRIIELKGEVEGPDGTLTRKKEWRIRNVLSPLFESGRFFVQRHQQDFIGEFNTFPRGKFCDLLDAMAYIPQMLRGGMSHANNLLLLQANQRRAQLVNRPYCSGVAQHVN
jgi:phage terminase large subunit-like protein